MGTPITESTEKVAVFSIISPETKAELDTLPQEDVEVSIAQVTREIPGLDSLGSSYNVFDLYANPKSARIPLFDFGPQHEIDVGNKLTFLIPDSVTFRTLNQSTYQEAYGKEINEYTQSLVSSTKLSGGYGYFSSSLQVDFSTESRERSYYEYNSVENEIQKWSLRLPSGTTTLRTMVLPEVRQELDTPASAGGLTPKQLFDKYGTHFLYEVIVGARAAYNTATNEKTYHSEYSVETIAKMSYESLTGTISAEDKKKYGETIDRFQSSSQTTIYTLGGNPEYGRGIFYGAYDKWVESVIENPVFCAYAPDSLRPIWELCNDETRRAELAAAYPAYAEAATPPAVAYALTGLAVVGGSSSGVAPPYGYTKINQDLNEGAGGDFIYVCYQEAVLPPGSPKAVTDMTIVEGKGASPPPGYTKIDYDLNKGAGGAFLYLCYARDPAKENDPIRSITVISGNSSGIPAPYGYEKIPTDCNKGAGGKFIYICYSRHF